MSGVAAELPQGNLTWGRPGTEPGSRELVIGGTPYIVSYWRERERVTISTIQPGDRSLTRETMSTRPHNSLRFVVLIVHGVSIGQHALMQDARN